MKKKILKNVAILSFALFGLGIIGHNVSYATGPIHEGPGDGGGGTECPGGSCSNWFCEACCALDQEPTCTFFRCKCTYW